MYFCFISEVLKSVESGRFLVKGSGMGFSRSVRPLGTKTQRLVVESVTGDPTNLPYREKGGS